MLSIIIRKEIQDSLASLRFVLTLLLCTVTILFTVWAGAESYRRDMKNFAANESLDRKLLDAQNNYNTFMRVGVKINKEPEALEALVSGVKDIAGNTAWVADEHQTVLEGSKSGTNPFFAVFGGFDLTFVVSVIFSLLAFLYSYNTVSGEKEKGTLRLLLANQISRPTLILGKYMGSLISLLIPVLIPMLLGLIVLANYPDVSLNSEHWLRILLLVALYLLYITCFFTLGLLSSSLVSHSSISLLISLLAWICCIALIPRASVNLAGLISPVASQSEINFQKEAIYRQIHDEIYKKENLALQIQEFREKHPGNRNYGELTEKLAGEEREKKEAQFSLIDTDYEAKKLRQQQLAADIARCSPTSALMFGSMALGRTGPAEYDKFLQSAREYRTVFLDWITAKSMKFLTEHEAFDLSGMPRHTIAKSTLTESVTSAIPDYLVLILLNILFFAGAYVSFLRYDVR
ncbi:ABC transporter permease subunit [bacterium]|nr:ABC transporter permease subunit [bacterium]